MQGNTFSSKFFFTAQKMLPNYKNITLVYKGNPDVWALLRQNTKQLKEAKIYIYQRQPLDIFYQMLKQKVRTLTYVTPVNYQTVICKPLIKQYDFCILNGKACKTDQLSQAMKNNKLLIKKSFIDIHPYEAYHKLCSFLKAKKSKKVTKVYEYCNFSKQEIQQSTIFLPFLKKARERYLKTDQLKLRKLDRLREATPLQIKESIQEWYTKFHIDGLYPSTSQQEEEKWSYALQLNLGQFVSVEELLEGYGQKSFYAPWVDADAEEK